MFRKNVQAVYFIKLYHNNEACGSFRRLFLKLFSRLKLEPMATSLQVFLNVDLLVLST